MTNIDDIILHFKNLPDSYWDFTTYENNQYVHKMHNYPAVMIYPISRNIISIINEHSQIDSIFDPFMGSGTILIEAQLANIKKIAGNDLNPLSNLITSARTTVLNNKEIFLIKKYLDKIEINKQKINDISIDFLNYIVKDLKLNIFAKEGWANNYYKHLSTFLSDNKINYVKIEDISNNFGYWFKPDIILSLFYLKTLIMEEKDQKIKNFLLCALSEATRTASNTRNGEFKIYRMSLKQLEKHNVNTIEIFNEILIKNLQKIIEYSDKVENSATPSLTSDNSMDLRNHNDDTYDLIITSPPYGDSKTTVAYGQFSRLSLQFLGILHKNIDIDLLGGRSKKVSYEILSYSKTLKNYYNKIFDINEKRAKEVYSFYEDLFYSFKEIAKKSKHNGLQFWVVANRTVREIVIPLDKILIEFAPHVGLKYHHKMFRKIGNKVMPIFNSPKNEKGQQVKTMTDETIIIFEKS